MMELLAELKRRQMFRVAAAYAVVAWVLLQFANNITPALRLPEWIPTAVVVLLMIGFPVALLFCWIQQLAPGGESS
jgi:fucose permease